MSDTKFLEYPTNRLPTYTDYGSLCLNTYLDLVHKETDRLYERVLQDSAIARFNTVLHIPSTYFCPFEHPLFDEYIFVPGFTLLPMALIDIKDGVFTVMFGPKVNFHRLASIFVDPLSFFEEAFMVFNFGTLYNEDKTSKLPKDYLVSSDIGNRFADFFESREDYFKRRFR